MNGSKRKQRYEALTLYFLMGLVHRNFMLKASGRADDLGNRWAPLKPSTKIYKPLIKGESKSLGVRKYSNSLGLLTPRLSNLWRGVYSSLIRKGKSPNIAAKMAWGIVKSKGGKTKKESLSNREVLILITTKRLEKSLRPGRIVDNNYIPSPEQVANIRGNVVTIGSLVPYAGDVANTRPPIPENIQPWISRAQQQALRQIKLEQTNGSQLASSTPRLPS